jgi:hypothetical protein
MELIMFWNFSLRHLLIKFTSTEAPASNNISGISLQTLNCSAVESGVWLFNPTWFGGLYFIGTFMKYYFPCFWIYNKPIVYSWFDSKIKCFLTFFWEFYHVYFVENELMNF